MDHRVRLLNYFLSRLNGYSPTDQGPPRSLAHVEKMLSFYRITLFLLYVVNAQGSEECFPPDSDFASVGCMCEGVSIRCESRDRLSVFPVLNGTFDIVTEM